MQDKGILILGSKKSLHSLKTSRRHGLLQKEKPTTIETEDDVGLLILKIEGQSIDSNNHLDDGNEVSVLSLSFQR